MGEESELIFFLVRNIPIKKSLRAYQKGKIEINLTERDKHAAKKEVQFVFYTDLLNFYYSLPYSKKVGIVEESLGQYLNKISLGSKELEKYRKIIKPKKPQKKLTPYRLECFGCDNCGDEYYDEIVYSYAPSLKQINNYQIIIVIAWLVSKKQQGILRKKSGFSDVFFFFRRSEVASVYKMNYRVEVPRNRNGGSMYKKIW